MEDTCIYIVVLLMAVLKWREFLNGKVLKGRDLYIWLSHYLPASAVTIWDASLTLLVG